MPLITLNIRNEFTNYNNYDIMFPSESENPYRRVLIKKWITRAVLLRKYRSSSIILLSSIITILLNELDKALNN